MKKETKTLAEFKKEFNDWLDENTALVEIDKISYLPSTVLQEIDPVEYDKSFDNWYELNKGS